MRPAEWSVASRAFGSYLLTAGKSKETVRTYSSAVSLFWRWCDEREIYAVEAPRALLRQYLTEAGERVSSARVHSYLASLRHFYAFIIDEGVRDDDPTAKLRIKRTETLPTQPIEDDELVALMGACTNERDRLIIRLLTYSGVRISEFAGMTAEDIDWRHGLIKIHGKGDREGLVEPGADVMGQLHAFLGLFPSGPLWLSLRDRRPLKAHQLRKIIYRITEHAGLDDIHPHRFRSTFACNFIEQHPGDLHALKGAMRHKSVDTTQRYTQAVEVKRGLQKMRDLRFAI